MAFPIQEKVLGLQISVDDVQFVKVLDSCDYLVEEIYSFWLLDALVFDDVVKELSARRVLHD